MFKVVSWNVNSVRVRFHCIDLLIKDESPDVILLQETKVTDENFPFEYVHDLGYDVVYHGQKSYNGVAIMSKKRIEDVNRGFLNEARYIDAMIEGNRIASIYVPNGRSVEDPQYNLKEEFYTLLKERSNQIQKSNESIIWGGDFNVAPFDNDIWDHEKYIGHVACTPKERRWLSDLKFTGLVDPLHKYDNSNLPSQKNDFTWWDYRAGGFPKNRGWRIDYFLMCKNNFQKFTNGGVLKRFRSIEKTSDHAPIFCSLDL